MFCEGTRFTKEKHEQSLKIAREKGLPEFKYHLLPRPKGFSFVVNRLKDHVDYIYDVNMGLHKLDNGRYPLIIDLVKGRSYECEMYIRRIPIDKEIAQDEKKLTQFLYKMYKEKVRKQLNIINF